MLKGLEEDNRIQGGRGDRSSAMKVRKGGPGMPEMLTPTSAPSWVPAWASKVALMTDGRFSGGSARVHHRACHTGGAGWRNDRTPAGRRQDHTSTRRVEPD